MSYLHIMTQCDPNFHLKVNINRYDLFLWSSDFAYYLLDYLMDYIIVGTMHQCDHQINFSSICRSVTYILWPNKFASCLEDYLLQESCTWDDRSVSLRD